MTGVVVDASAFGPFLIPDEAGEMIAGLDEAISEYGATVPQHWALEVSNMVLLAARRSRVSPFEFESALAVAQESNIRVDPETGIAAFGETLALASRHGLTAYDAAYLELAIRLKQQLATHDKALIGAARAESVELFTV